MLGCDNCDRWFHGSCMKIDTATGDALSNWICPLCSEGNCVQTANAEIVQSAGDKNILAQENANPIPHHQHHTDISPHAPNPISLWPPFGLRGSKEATEALGKAGDSDNEDFQFSAQPAVKAHSAPSSTNQPHVLAVSASVPSLNMSQILEGQPVVSGVITNGSTASQSDVCRAVKSMPIVTDSKVASTAYHSKLESFQAAQTQSSDMINNQQMAESSPPTQSATIETNHQLTSSMHTPTVAEAKIISPKFQPFASSSALPIIGINPGHTINTVGLGVDLSVAVANLDAIVLAAEGTQQISSGSSTVNSLEVGAPIGVNTQPP